MDLSGIPLLLTHITEDMVIKTISLDYSKPGVSDESLDAQEAIRGVRRSAPSWTGVSSSSHSITGRTFFMASAHTLRVKHKTLSYRRCFPS